MDPETCGTANTLLYLGADIDMQMLKYLGANETHAIYVDPLVSSTGGLDDYAKVHATDPRPWYRNTSMLLRPFTKHAVPQLHELLLGRLAHEIGLRADPTVLANMTIRFAMSGKERVLRYAVADVWRFACDQRQRPVLEGAIGKVSTLGMIGVKIPLIVMRWLGHLLRIGRCSQIRVICVAEDRDAYQAAFGPLLLSSRLYGYRTRDTLSAPEEYHGETQGDDDGDVWSNVFSTASLRRYEAAWGAFSCDQMVAAKLVDDDNGPHLLGGPVPMDASSTNDSLAAARAPHMPSRHRCSSSAPCTNWWRPCPCVSPRAGSSHDQVQERAGDRGSSSPQMPQHGG